MEAASLRSQIHRRLAEPDAIRLVNELLDGNRVAHRTELADRLCEQLGLRDPRGRLQRSGCLKALRRLEANGSFTLPPPVAKTGFGDPRRLDRSVAQPVGVPDAVGGIRDLRLLRVEADEHLLIWNELFAGEHPWGAGPLVGRQLRYLAGSAHGWLGGLGFASAALQLHDRDRWIGWDVSVRREQLDRVVGLSRFLVRPSVACRNLASHLLALATARLPEDFEREYGYRPWLVETFVDTSRHAGSCYRAANWIRVGSTQGRGRQDPQRRHAETVKDIYVRPLVEDFRARMGLSAHDGLGALPLDAGLEGERWAEHEFGGAPLGDRRLSRRLVQSAALLAQMPGEAISAVAQGARALVKGHYRFIDQPDDSALSMENILAPHREQTLRRMQSQTTVLCVQDGTKLNYDGLAECEGLGVIGSNQTEAKSRGLQLHSTLAVSDEGIPLGVLRTQCWAPSAPEAEGLQSGCWIEAVHDVAAIAQTMPHTRVITVMDREADDFALFDAWRNGARPTELLVRAQHNRRTTETLKLFDWVKASEPQLRFRLHIKRQSARPKRSKQQARAKRKERVADVAIRYRAAELKPPSDHKGKAPIPLWIVHVMEEQPSASVKPVEWFLLTTMAIETPEQAQKCVEYYGLRWRIEDWHRVLKSGCEIEELGHQTAERLKRAIAIYAVIAWRVMLMTLLGRETPDLPAEILFSDLELEVLSAFADTRSDLKKPERLGDAVLAVAKLAGYLNRKNDPPPGHQVMWQGYTALSMMCLGYSLRSP